MPHLTHFGLLENDRGVQKLHKCQLLQLEANCRLLGFEGFVLRVYATNAVYSLHLVLLTSSDVVALQAGYRYWFLLRHKTKMILWVIEQARSSSQEEEGH